MHISEGVLSAPVLAAGIVLTVAGTAAGLKQLDEDKLVHAGVLSAVFFTASLIHVPVGPANAHLVMNGLAGLILGWAAFPVILVGLILQALLFQFGGITTLGVNTVIMALPAVAVHALFSRFLCGLPPEGAREKHIPNSEARRNGHQTSSVNRRKRASSVSGIIAFCAGFSAVFFSAIIMAASLYFTNRGFLTVAAVTAAIHLPVMVIEGLICLFCVRFIQKTKPELLPFARRK